MLQKLILKNFQRHERFVLKFDPAVTVLVGPSDVGKSAVLRALAAVCLNRAGEHLVKSDAKEFLVKLYAEDRCVYRRRGRRGAGTYRLDAKTYAAVGRDVPADIKSLLNVDDHNFQLQFDPSFWIASSAGQVSKALNVIVNLQSIDATVLHANQRVKKLQMVADLAANRLVKARADLKATAGIPALCEALKHVRSLKDAREAKTHSIAQVRRSLAGLVEALATVDRLSGATLGGKSVVALGTRAGEAGRKARKLKDVLTSLKRAAGVSRPPNLRSVEHLRNNLEGARLKVESLQDLIADLSTKEEECHGLRERVRLARGELERRTGGHCPLCGAGPLPSS